MGNPEITIEQHMQRYEVQGNGCWHWTGYVSPHGYGSFYKRAGVPKPETFLVHRVSHELHNGEIPEGYHVDHVCHNKDESCREGVNCLHRRCINPEHLEAVPPRVNILRGRGPAADNSAKELCQEGHPLEGDNLYVEPSGGRICKTCRRVTHKKYYDSGHGGDKKREYARERMQEKRKDPEYQEYKRRKERERYWRNKAKKESE